MTDDIAERLRKACNGHPHAKVPWPHRLLHEAANSIEALKQRCEELERAALARDRSEVDWVEHIAALEAALRGLKCPGHSLRTIGECTDSGKCVCSAGRTLTSAAEDREDDICSTCSGEGCPACSAAHAECNCTFRLGHRVLTPSDCPLHGNHHGEGE